MDSYQRISVQAAQEMIANGTVSVIDIRDEQSFAGGHISQSSHLDNAGVQQFIQDADLDIPVIVCCYHGNMSQSAAAFLIEQGFEDVYSLDGGFAEWSQVYPDQCQSLPPSD